MFAYRDSKDSPSLSTPSAKPTCRLVKLSDSGPPDINDEFVDAAETTPEDAPADGYDQPMLLVNAAARKSDLPPSDIRRVLSNPKSKPNIKVETNLHNLVYRVSSSRRNPSESLVDRVANGGIAGSNTRLIAKTDRHVDVSGIDDHQMTNLDIVTAGGVIPTQRGDVIVILHQYAYVPRDKPFTLVFNSKPLVMTWTTTQLN